MEGVLMIKNVSLKLVSFINGGGIGDQEHASQTLLLSFINGGGIGDEEHYLSNSSANLQWMVYW